MRARQRRTSEPYELPMITSFRNVHPVIDEERVALVRSATGYVAYAAEYGGAGIR